MTPPSEKKNKFAYRTDGEKCGCATRDTNVSEKEENCE